MRTLWENIRTLRRNTDRARCSPLFFGFLSKTEARRTKSPAFALQRALALCLCAVLFATLPGDVLAQNSRSKKRSKKPKAPACKNCKPGTAVPEIAPVAAEDAALQKELVELGHGLRMGEPGIYDRLAAYAKRNAGNVWGGRAALALGYQDYSKN